MKKVLFVILALAILVLPSCKKTRYCRCTTIQNEEVVNLGEEYYTIEDNSSFDTWLGTGDLLRSVGI